MQTHTLERAKAQEVDLVSLVKSFVPETYGASKQDPNLFTYAFMIHLKKHKVGKPTELCSDVMIWFMRRAKTDERKDFFSECLRTCSEVRKAVAFAKSDRIDKRTKALFLKKLRYRKLL